MLSALSSIQKVLNHWETLSLSVKDWFRVPWRPKGRLGLGPFSLDSGSAALLTGPCDHTVNPSALPAVLKRVPVTTHPPFFLASEILFLCTSGPFYHMPCGPHFRSVPQDLGTYGPFSQLAMNQTCSWSVLLSSALEASEPLPPLPLSLGFRALGVPLMETAPRPSPE